MKLTAEEKAKRRVYYYKNRPGYRNNTKKYRDKMRDIIRAHKDKPCMDCGIKYIPFVMDLDHVRGTKKFTISQCGQYGMRQLLVELEKCDAVCSNCHRMRTFYRKQITGGR